MNLIWLIKKAKSVNVNFHTMCLLPKFAKIPARKWIKVYSLIIVIIALASYFKRFFTASVTEYDVYIN